MVQITFVALALLPAVFVAAVPQAGPSGVPCNTVCPMKNGMPAIPPMPVANGDGTATCTYIDGSCTYNADGTITTDTTPDQSCPSMGGCLAPPRRRRGGSVEERQFAPGKRVAPPALPVPAPVGGQAPASQNATGSSTSASSQATNSAN